jgi:hypothetical protein
MTEIPVLLRRIAAGAVICTCIHSGTAMAADKPFPPPQKEVCTASNIVDKDKLADYLLTKFPVNVRALQSTTDPTLQRLSLLRQLLASPILADPSQCKTCSASDKASLSAIQGNMAQVLAGSLKLSFDPSSPVDPNVYFRAPTNEENAIRCIVANGQPVEAPSALYTPPEKSQSNFRIRGAAADLYVDRSATQDFAATSKATIDFNDNGTAKTRTDKFVADIGYRIPITTFDSMPGSRLELIPYAGTSRNIVTVGKGSKTKPSASETADLGALTSMYLVTGSGPTPFGHLINFRPDYLFDLQDDSQLLTANLQYLPVINSIINSFRPVITGNDSFASYKIIFDLRNDNGVYTNRGKASVASSHKSFSRLGGQVGLAVLSDYEPLPLSFTSTYTGLYGISGNRNISYFVNTLTFYLDSNKYWGISASYANGVKEDTAKRDQQWDIALSVHY